MSQGTALPMCACGSYSMGSCTGCGEARCDNCSKVKKGQRTCNKCRAERKRQAKAEEKAALAAQIAELQPVIDAIHAIRDDVERVIRSVGLISEYPNLEALKPILLKFNRGLKLDFPDPWAKENPLPLWLSMQKVSGWLADYCVSRGISPDFSVNWYAEKWGIRRRKGQFRGWLVPAGWVIHTDELKVFPGYPQPLQIRVHTNLPFMALQGNSAVPLENLVEGQYVADSLYVFQDHEDQIEITMEALYEIAVFLEELV